MFNLGSGEIALIAIAALLILGPKRLPELARGLGKFMREFRRQTDEVRGVVEREFYRMDGDVRRPEAPAAPRPVEDSLAVRPAEDTVALGSAHGPPEEPHEPDALPAPPDDVGSQLTKGMPQGEPVAPPPTPPAKG